MAPQGTAALEISSPCRNGSSIFDNEPACIHYWDSRTARSLTSRNMEMAVGDSFAAARISESKLLLSSAARRLRQRQIQQQYWAERVTSRERTFMEGEGRFQRYQFQEQQARSLTKPHAQASHSNRYRSQQECAPSWKHQPRQDPPGRHSRRDAKGVVEDERISQRSTRAAETSQYPTCRRFQAQDTEDTEDVVSVENPSPSRVVLAHKRLLHLELRKAVRRSDIRSSQGPTHLLKPSHVNKKSSKLSFHSMNQDSGALPNHVNVSTEELVARAKRLVHARRSMVRRSDDDGGGGARSQITPHSANLEDDPVVTKKKLDLGVVNDIVGKLARLEDASCTGPIPREVDSDGNCHQDSIDKSVLGTYRQTHTKKSVMESAERTTRGSIFLQDNTSFPFPQEDPVIDRNSKGAASAVIFTHESSDISGRTISLTSSSSFSEEKSPRASFEAQNNYHVVKDTEDCLETQTFPTPDEFRPFDEPEASEHVTSDEDVTTPATNVVLKCVTPVQNSQCVEMCDGDHSVGGFSVQCSIGVASDIALPISSTSSTPEKQKWRFMRRLRANSSSGTTTSEPHCNKHRRDANASDTSMHKSTSIDSEASAGSGLQTKRVLDSPLNYSPSEKKRHDQVACFVDPSFLLCRKGRLAQKDWFLDRHRDQFPYKTGEEGNVMEMVFFD
jgi:hypothetical protein